MRNYTIICVLAALCSPAVFGQSKAYRDMYGTAAQRPTAAFAGVRNYVITDAQNKNDCGASLTGGGSTIAVSFSNGTAWACSTAEGSGGLGDPGGNGFVDRTALNTTFNRTLTGTASEISITNGGGGGNPVFSLDATVVQTDKANTWGAFAQNFASATVTLPTSITITTPTIASFTNAQHNHTNAAGGGTLGSNTVGSSQITDGQVAPADMTAAARQITESWNLESPTTGDSGKWQKFYSSTCTMQRVWCSTDAGTVTIQLDKRAEATPNTAGTNILTSSLVCDNNTEATTAFASAGVTQDLPVGLVISAVSGATNLRVGARCQRD